jgi:hypothetical protein
VGWDWTGRGGGRVGGKVWSNFKVMGRRRRGGTGSWWWGGGGERKKKGEGGGRGGESVLREFGAG